MGDNTRKENEPYCKPTQVWYIYMYIYIGEWDNYYKWTRQISKTTLSRATVYQKHSLLHIRNNKYSKWYLPGVW